MPAEIGVVLSLYYVGACPAMRMELSATDRTADSGQVVCRFAGTWELVWAGAGRGWTLIHPDIHAIK